MITRRNCLIVSIVFLLILVISLLLNLHGALAVVSAICFAFFLSAFIDSCHKFRRNLKRIFGTILCLFAMVGILSEKTDQNIVFVVTLLFIGIIFVFDSITFWIIKSE